ncbi:MAG: response regulator [bacterium]|nr:response regulator [bacterium]
MEAKDEKLNILLVDDDKFLVDMYCMKFAASGCNPHACLSVDDALQVLRDGFNPHAIIFDVVMPEHDGFYLLKTLGEENLGKGAVRIALTNESDDATKSKMIELGADRVIIKASMIPSEVVDAVKKEVERRKA